MQTVTDVQAHILLKVGEDSAFREQLVADPKGVIEAEIGRVLPDDVLVFVQEAVATAQQQVPSVDAPLTQDELIQVMGGTGYGCLPGHENADAWTVFIEC